MNLKEQFKRIGGTVNEVDYSTMRLKSNIDQKWDSADVMTNDLKQWIQSLAATSGPELGIDVADALKQLVPFAERIADRAAGS